jgi:hypothetical protein
MIPGFHPEIWMYAMYVTTNVLLLLSVQMIKGNVLLVTNKWCLIQQVDETVAATRQLPQQTSRENLKEELHSRKKAVLSEIDVKNFQIQHLEIVTECTGGVQEKDLISDEEKKPASVTGHSSEIWETNIEDDVTRHRSDNNSDGSDDDISFVKL